ncbi:MAG TPA: hypothetical protein VJ883_06915 [Woeseiaceae bacterium]|jgi:hypothetical protein|nr:hypothetical protein [Woeseiaceae bacterium]
MVYTDVYFLGAAGAMGTLLLAMSALWIQQWYRLRRGSRRDGTTA